MISKKEEEREKEKERKRQRENQISIKFYNTSGRVSRPTFTIATLTPF